MEERGINSIRKHFIISVIFFSLISVSILLTLFHTLDDTQTLTFVGIIVGLMFWIGLLGGCVSYGILWKKYKKKIVAELPQGKIPTFLRFFCNPFAAINDSIFILSLVLAIYCGMQIKVNTALEFISMLLFITSLYMHFLLTGRVFQYIAKKGKGAKGL